MVDGPGDGERILKREAAAVVLSTNPLFDEFVETAMLYSPGATAGQKGIIGDCPRLKSVTPFEYF